MERRSTALLLSLLLAVAAEDTDIGVIIDGNITIGGLFPITQGGCLSIESQRGIQRMEAMIFSLSEANSDQSLLRYGKHKITVGGLLLDTCSSARVVRVRVTEFLKSSLGNEYTCRVAPSAVGSLSSLPVRVSGGATSRIRGVVGAAYSGVTGEAASMLQLLSVPLISYASSSDALSNRHRYELLARTLPSDSEQVIALADIVAHFNWTYMSVVLSEGSYGANCMKRFSLLMERIGSCFSVQEVIRRGASRMDMDQTVERLLQQTRARVVVLFTFEDDTEKLLSTVSRAKANVPAGHFVWLSADGWGTSGTPVARNSLVAMGALTIQLKTGKMPGFTEHFTSIRPGAQRGSRGAKFVNKYFDAFWQQTFNCSLGNQSEVYGEKCNDSVTIGFKQFKQDSKVQFVYDAVYAFVHGLDKLMKRVCSSQDPDSDTIANGMFERCVKNISDFPGNELYDILIGKNNSFINNAGRTVELTDSGDRAADYSIYNYQKNSITGSYDYKAVGEWRRGVGLTWDIDQHISWSHGGSEPPTSVCSDECSAGYRKKYRSGREKCCWFCFES